MNNSDEKHYGIVGPFTVESEGNPFIGRYRCWLTSDSSKRVLCEGSARDIEVFTRGAANASDAKKPQNLSKGTEA